MKLSLCGVLIFAVFGCADHPKTTPQDQMAAQPKSSMLHQAFDQDCSTFGAPYIDPHVSGPDTEAPVISAINFGKDTYLAGERVRILLDAIDNLSGVSHLAGIELVNQAGQNVIGTQYLEVPRFYVNGTGTLCNQQIGLSNNALSGDYYLQRIVIYDYADNSREYVADDTRHFYVGTSLPVIKLNYHY